MKMGERLARFRISLGMSVADYANRGRMERTAVYNREGTNTPSLSTVVDYLKVLKGSLEIVVSLPEGEEVELYSTLGKGEHIGSALKNTRKRFKHTQASLCKRMDSHTSVVTRLETSGNASLSTIHRYLVGLGCHVRFQARTMKGDLVVVLFDSDKRNRLCTLA